MTNTADLLHVSLDVLPAVVDQFGITLSTPTPGGNFQLPDAPPQAPPELTAYFTRFLGAIKWIAGAVAVLSMCVIAIKMTLGNNNRTQLAASGAASIPWLFVGLVVAATPVSIVGFVLGGS